MKCAKIAKQLAQLTLEDARKPTGRGGWRPNAGRPKGRKTFPHETRPDFAPRHPLHVTWRFVDGAPYMRRFHPAAIVREAICSSTKPGFAIVEFSLQGNHLHMIIEAAGKKTFTSGMQGLARRIKAGFTKKLGWKGQLFTPCHTRALTSPREVRNALRYVLLNARHHASETIEKQNPYWVDPYSSGFWFDGWSKPITHQDTRHETLASQPRPTAVARTWLLAVGWKRGGLLDFAEEPGPRRRRR